VASDSEANRGAIRANHGNMSTTAPAMQRSNAVRRAFLSGVGVKGPTIVLTMLAMGLAARSLGADSFGVVATFAGTVGLFGFLDLGIGNAVINPLTMAAADKNYTAMRRLLASSVAALFGVGALLAALGALAAAAIPQSLLFRSSDLSENSVRQCLFIFAVTVGLALPASLGVKVSVALQAGYLNGIMFLVSSLMTFISVVIGALGKLGVTFYVFGMCTLPVVCAAGLSLYLVRYAGKGAWRPSVGDIGWSTTRSLVVRGFPFIGLSLAGILTYQTDTLVIAYVLGPSAVAVFALTFRMFNVVTSLYAVGLQQFWASLTHAFAANDDLWVRRTVRRTLLYVGGTATFGSVALVLSGREIVRLWAGEEVVPPWSLLVVMGVWSVYSLLMNILSALLNSLGKVSAQAMAGFAMAAVSVPLSIGLARTLGVAGPVLASTLAHLVCVLPVSLFLLSRSEILSKRRDG
jgi:O-antigen/teichoic acid export membrane protein